MKYRYNMRQVGVLLSFAALIALFMMRLEIRVHEVSVSMINQPVPNFSAYDLQRLSVVYDKKIFLGKVTILHIWSSWCRECQADNQFLLSLPRHHHVRIIGLNYLDNREEALDWLSVYGNPYRGNIFDSTGTLTKRLGVYAAPETYIIDKKGMIRYKVVGQLTEALWQEKLAPLIRIYAE